jgi:hypothetical protein
MAHSPAAVGVLQRLVRPQVAAADRGPADADEGVGRFDDAGIGDVLDADVTGPVKDCCGSIEALRRAGWNP